MDASLELPGPSTVPVQVRPHEVQVPCQNHQRQGLSAPPRPQAHAAGPIDGVAPPADAFEDMQMTFGPLPNVDPGARPSLSKRRAMSWRLASHLKKTRVQHGVPDGRRSRRCRARPPAPLLAPSTALRICRPASLPASAAEHCADNSAAQEFGRLSLALVKTGRRAAICSWRSI